MPRIIGGYAAIAKYYQDKANEQEECCDKWKNTAESLSVFVDEQAAQIASLKAELAEQIAQGERLQTLAAKFQGEADDAQQRADSWEKKADHWEQDYHSLNRDYDRLLKQ
jgi:methyl-accepting chemotaxis protein